MGREAGWKAGAAAGRSRSWGMARASLSPLSIPQLCHVLQSRLGSAEGQAASWTSKAAHRIQTLLTRGARAGAGWLVI